MGKHPQVATIWKFKGVDFNNQPTFEAPRKVNVRWEDVNRLIIEANGREVRGRSRIYFPEDEFEMGDFIARGEWSELVPIRNALEIKNKSVITNISGTRAEYRADA